MSDQYQDNEFIRLEQGEVVFWSPPPSVGYYRLGSAEMSTQMRLNKKPNWWHRFWMKACLGWEWIDG